VFCCLSARQLSYAFHARKPPVDDFVRSFWRGNSAGNLAGVAVQVERLAGELRRIERPEPRLWCGLSNPRGLFHPNAKKVTKLVCGMVSAMLIVG